MLLNDEKQSKVIKNIVIKMYSFHLCDIIPLKFTLFLDMDMSIQNHSSLARGELHTYVIKIP